MAGLNDQNSGEGQKPIIIEDILTRRWKYVKTQIYKLASDYSKKKIIKELVKQREEFTSQVRLPLIMMFSGCDVAIHTLLRWDEWTPQPKHGLPISIAARDIATFGTELVLIHTLRQALKNGLFREENGKLITTSRGEKHFSRLHSFDVKVSGTTLDVARMQWRKKRRKHAMYRKGYRSFWEIPPSVIELHTRNAFLMFLRSPIPFYRSMAMLSPEEIEALVKFSQKLRDMAEETTSHSGLYVVKLKKESIIAKALMTLSNVNLQRIEQPAHLVALYEGEENNKKIFVIGLEAFSLFTTFLESFDLEALEDKAHLAEEAVKDIIEMSNTWEIVNMRYEVVENEGEEDKVITEIDIIAKKIDEPSTYILIEVKDYSFWGGWIYGGSERKRTYYKEAAKKMELRKKIIAEEFNAKKVYSLFVSSVPEPFAEISGIPVVFIEDLSTILAELSGNPEDIESERQRPTNFLLKYYESLISFINKSESIDTEIQRKKKKKHELFKKKKKYEQKVNELNTKAQTIKSELRVLLARKKLLKKKRAQTTDHDKIVKIRAEIKQIDKELIHYNHQLENIEKKIEEENQEIEKIEASIYKLRKEIDRLASKKAKILGPHRVWR